MTAAAPTVEEPVTAAVTNGRRTRNRTQLVFAIVVLVALLGAGADAMRRGVSDAAPGGRERVILADFTNLTSDSTYDELLAHILRNELAQSPRLSVVGSGRIAEVQSRMRLEPGTRLDADMAREIAAREEVKLVVAGDVRAVGAGLVISAAVIEVASGEEIHGGSETARDSSEVLAAIERLSNGIRQGIGESLASIQAGDSLWSFTSSSLPALQRHMAGSRALLRGDFLTSVELLEEGIELDPDFAYAYRLLASALTQAGLPEGRARRSYARAYDLRDRITDRERYTIEGNYHLHVTGDVTRAIVAFRKHIEALKQFPIGEPGHYSNLAAALQLIGNDAAAEAVLQEGRVRFPSAGNLTSLINVLYIQRKDDEAFIGTSDHPELARVYQELGQADSAIAVYERYLGVRSLTRLSLDAIELGGALEQLAALYEMRGDRTKAAAQSHRLAELWRHADAAVQPRVEAARRRARPPD